MRIMSKFNQEAFFQDAALVPEEETPLQSPTHPAAISKLPSTGDHQADLATTVDGGSGVLQIDSTPSQRIHVIPCNANMKVAKQKVKINK